jgi:hypothetical protein
VASGHHQEGEPGLPGKLEDREDIQAIAQSVVLGVSDGLTLLESTDSMMVLAVGAVTAAAEKYRKYLDEELARRIVEVLGESMG